MTKKELRKRTRQLIQIVGRHMRKNLERVIKEDMTDHSQYEDNWLLPKTVLLALLKEEQYQYRPPEDRKYAKCKKLTEKIYSQL
ncbi:MAG: hypothetical protein E7075_01730 [Bacteroidales bacterium]|nr:hypothetical protein [Bacteroidales bacterium]